MNAELKNEAVDLKRLEENLLKLSPERLFYMAGFLDGLTNKKELQPAEPA